MRIINKNRKCESCGTVVDKVVISSDTNNEKKPYTRICFDCVQEMYELITAQQKATQCPEK